MCCPRLVLVSVSVCVGLTLSGCSNPNLMNANPPTTPAAAPTVVAVGEQVNGVAPNRWQYVQFNEAMDPRTINSQTIVVMDSSGSAVAGNVSYDANFDVAGFQPNPALQDNATYTFTVTTGVASSQDVHLAAAYTYKFTTRASTDSSPIYVKNVTPFPDAQCVSATNPITITFSEGADISTLNSTNIVISGPGNTVIPAQISYDVATATVTLAPNAPLPSGSITVTVNNVADAAGVKMTSPFMWSFLTTCSGGGGSTTTQYQAPLGGKTGSGRVTVDTAGNVTIQLQGGAANQTFTVQFCPMMSLTQTSPNCFSVAALSTDANGSGSVTAKFPQSGPWAGDFQLVNGPVSPSGFTFDYETTYGPNYFSTLQPSRTVDGGILSAQTNNNPQAPLKSGTVTYSSTPAPNGSFQFTLAGAPANTTFQASEGTLATGGSSNYVLVSSQGVDAFKSDSQGDLTFTVLQDGTGGDILSVGPEAAQQGYIGGFSVP